MEKNMVWIKLKVAKDLHALFKRAAYDLDPESRSLAHFGQLAMQERADRLMKEAMMREKRVAKKG